MKDQICCAHCACLFSPNPRVKDQRYCANKACQRARKRLWQKKKLTRDPEYKQNQQDSKERWRKQNPGYWKNYRLKNPAYADRNRQLQRARDSRTCPQANLAKMDVSTPPNFPIKPGPYCMFPYLEDLAKMDTSLCYKFILIPMD